MDMEFDFTDNKRQRSSISSHDGNARHDAAALTVHCIGKNNWENGEASQISRYPPDIFVPVSEVNQLFLCNICKCYIYHATTVIECMHTFCRKCIYYHIERSKKCPTCTSLLDPSNPIASLREDKIFQEILNKIFPSIETEEKEKAEKFYMERGIHPPENTQLPNKKKLTSRQNKIKHWMCIKLDFIGYNEKEVPPVNELKKSIIRLPAQTCVHHIQNFLALKLPLTDYFQALLFHQNYILHRDLTMEEVKLLFYQEVHHSEETIINLQYGIVPKGRDYFFLLATEESRSGDWVNPDSDSSEESNNDILLGNDQGLNNSEHSTNVSNNNKITEEKVKSREASEEQSSKKSISTRKSKGTACNSYSTIPGKICSICHKVQINIYQHINVVHSLNETERKEATDKCVRIKVSAVEKKLNSGQPRYCCVCNMIQLDVEQHVQTKHKELVRKRGLINMLNKCHYVYLSNNVDSYDGLLKFIHETTP